MFKGHIERKKSIQGYIDKNCVEVKSIVSRHAALAEEIKRRGYKHASELREVQYGHLSLADREYNINRAASQYELLRRCPRCFTNYLQEEHDEERSHSIGCTGRA
jgi:thermostable 8-oxoguanine DNA glycosylase